MVSGLYAIRSFLEHAIRERIFGSQQGSAAEHAFYKTASADHPLALVALCFNN